MMVTLNTINGMMMHFDNNTLFYEAEHNLSAFLVVMGKRLLGCDIQNIQIDAVLKEWAKKYSPQTYFYCLNRTIEYAKQCPTYKDATMFQTNKKFRTPLELFLDVKLSAKSNFSEWMHLVKKIDIKNKIRAKKVLTLKEYQFIKQFLAKEKIVDVIESEVRQITCEQSMIKKCMGYFAMLFALHYTCILLYVPVLLCSGLVTELGISVFKVPIIYFFGKNFIELHFNMIIHIGPLVCYFITLYKVMYKMYNEYDIIDIKQ